MAVSDIGKNALQVLEKRYLSKDAAGKPTENVEGMFRRVAVAVAAADARFDERADIVASAEDFFSLMTSLRFLPNSPTLMNAGRPLGQLSACFVLPVEDSMEGIFETVKQAALIHKSGGGTGFSFSRLRQNGAPVNSTGGVASGPVSFMRVFNMATEAVKQGGTRRGANMGILRVDHPDIEEFIHCKSVNTDITNFNLSVGITEAFMNAVENGDDYELIDPKTRKSVGTKNAKKMFDEIVDAAWHNGEPGIIFLDRLNRDNVVPSQGEIESTNPCGEQPLLPYESCNLGSINLVKMLRRTGEHDWEIDYEMLRKTIHASVHFLDNVIEINNYPLDKIAEVTRETRKIGLGVMGFADMLLYLGVPYNSDDAVELAENLMAFINIEGHNASKELARQRGAFPLFYSSIYAREAPLRNGTVTTIAPTGTLSMIGGCSSGVEPVFAYVYVRNIMDGTEMLEVNPVLKDVLERRGVYSEEIMRRVAKEGTLATLEELPEDIRRVFVCAHDISPEFHIRMQAAFQHGTDNAVSKTINLSHDATRADVAESYLLAYHLGCKGVTIYRDGSRGGQVLNIGSVKKDSTPEAEASAAGGGAGAAAGAAASGAIASPAQTAQISLPTEHMIVATMQPRPRPPVTMGFTERMKIGCGNLYVTVNYDENGICEVFTSTGKAGGCPSQSEATARLASVALRSGISVDEVYDQLKGIRCPSTIRQTGMSCTSCPDAIAKVLRKVDSFIKDKKDAKHGAPAPEPLTVRRASPQQPAVPQGRAAVQDVAYMPYVPSAAQGGGNAAASASVSGVAAGNGAGAFAAQAGQASGGADALSAFGAQARQPVDGGALGAASFDSQEGHAVSTTNHAGALGVPVLPEVREPGRNTPALDGGEMPDELRNPYAPVRERGARGGRATNGARPGGFDAHGLGAGRVGADGFNMGNAGVDTMGADGLGVGGANTGSANAGGAGGFVANAGNANGAFAGGTGTNESGASAAAAGTPPNYFGGFGGVNAPVLPPVAEFPAGAGAGGDVGANAAYGTTTEALACGVPNSIATPPEGEIQPAAAQDSMQGAGQGFAHSPVQGYGQSFGQPGAQAVVPDLLAGERLVAVPVPSTAGEIHRCPECDGPVEHEGGCVICRNCGFSKCG